ncbi:MAG: tetratricopeptide repeat protein [archaeon]
MNRQLLKEIISLAVARCGEDFSKKIDTLRRERERVLQNIWREDTLPEKLVGAQKDRLFRDIDFDTAIYHADKYLQTTEYLDLLYSIAEIAVKYGEMTRAEQILRNISDQKTYKADNNLLAKAHYKLGNVVFYQNNFKMADEELRKSLQLFKKINDEKGVALVSNAQGILLVQQGKISEGIVLIEEARKMAKRLNFTDLIINTNMNIGNAYHISGNDDAAMSHYREVLSLAEKSGQKDTLANMHLNIAIAYKFKGQLDRATTHVEKAFGVTGETNNLYQKGLAYLIKAEIACLRDDLSSGTALVTSAFSIFSEIGDRLSIAEAYKILGMINRKSKRFDIALSYLENSKRINEDLSHSLNLAETLMEISFLYMDIGDHEKTVKCLERSVGYFENIGAQTRAKDAKKILNNLST